jgi:protein phosphatase 2C family protein 2/3
MMIQNESNGTLEGSGWTSNGRPTQQVLEQPRSGSQQEASCVYPEGLAYDSCICERMGVSIGLSSSTGGRASQDDRAQAFSFTIWEGSFRYRCTVGAVLDGHHGSEVSELVNAMLPGVLVESVREGTRNSNSVDFGIQWGLRSSILKLDREMFDIYKMRNGSMTGGTTLLVLLMVLESSMVYTCNVGDCKAVLSVRGKAEPLTECHNPPVISEKRRFEEAGVDCFMDHIGGSDINVCRTIGDYDLGPPLKWRESKDMFSVVHGPLSCIPDISCRKLDEPDEFIVLASDGLWDYYTPESSIITDVRRHLRRYSMNGISTTVSNVGSSGNQRDQDGLAEDFTDACVGCADWLVESSLARQRDVLHEGTAGDNITVMFFQIRLLPQIPRACASRLNMGFGSSHRQSH